jgi:hypothetical protein
MIMKRKLEEIQPQGSVNYIPKYCFGFSVPEVSIADVFPLWLFFVSYIDRY